MSAPVLSRDTEPSPPPMPPVSADLVEAYASDVESAIEHVRVVLHDLELLRSGLARLAAEARR